MTNSIVATTPGGPVDSPPGTNGGVERPNDEEDGLTAPVSTMAQEGAVVRFLENDLGFVPAVFAGLVDLGCSPKAVASLARQKGVSVCAFMNVVRPFRRRSARKPYQVSFQIEEERACARRVGRMVDCHLRL